MPLLHCDDCHHEWEGSKNSKCDWCGGKAYVLANETQFEKFVKYDLHRIIHIWKSRFKKEHNDMKNKP
jgi:hypothetical protein